MVTPTRADAFSFSNSLASVMHKAGSDLELPDAGTLTIAQSREPSRLDELYSARDLTAFENSAIRPPHGLPPQGEMIWRLDALQARVAELGEHHAELAALSNEVNQVLLEEMKNRSALKLFQEAVLAG